MLFKSVDKKVELKMWEKTMMPESVMVDSVVNGKTKKEFQKTGKEVEMTTYTFRDEFGDKIVVLTKNNDYRALEGARGVIEFNVRLDEFTKKLKTTFSSFTPVKE